MKTVLVTLSVVNVAMGVFLAVMYLVTVGNPLMMLMLALALMVQGGFTLVYLSGLFDGGEPWSLRAQLVGSTLALLVGAGGLLTSIINNVLRPPPGADVEYGPMFVAGLFAAHAVASLYTFVVGGHSRPRPAASGSDGIGG